MDLLCELHRLVERLLHVASQLVEKLLGGGRITVHQSAGELQVDGQGDEVLVHAIVEVALDRATIVVSGLDETLPGSAQVRDLAAQALERPV